MRFDKEDWIFIRTFVKHFVFVFLLTYFACDVWRLSVGDMRPLKKKGILVEWFVRSQMEQNDSINKYNEKHTHAGFRITYTYHEPINPLKPLNH
jgi:hypothetical protein